MHKIAAFPTRLIKVMGVSFFYASGARIHNPLN
jgi:hypothetical protein